MKETQKVTYWYCDGKHGSKRVEAAASFSFDLDGEKGQADVCDEHLRELQRVVRQFTGKRSAPKRSAAPKGDASAIRQWARDNGYEVSDRGRISPALREAYQAAK